MEKIKLTIQVENSKPWTFCGTITHTEERLVVCQIFKQYLKKLFRKDNDVSYREMKELKPIKNQIVRMENAVKQKHPLEKEPAEAVKLLLSNPPSKQ